MSYDQKQLQIGTGIETESAEDPRLGQKIAMGNLRDDPKHYSKINAAGLAQEAGPQIAVIGVGTSTQGQQKLTSSGLGKNGVPKPLKSDNLDAPDGNNHVSAKKTAPLGGNTNCVSDPTEFFGSQISKALKAEVPRRMEMIPTNV